MEQNKDLPLELQETEEVKEEIKEETKETPQHFNFLQKLLVNYAKYLQGRGQQQPELNIPTMLIEYNISLSDFVKAAIINKNANDTDVIEAFVDCNYKFFSIICTQAPQFFEQGHKGMNLLYDDIITNKPEINDLVFSMLRIETEERVNIFIQYAMCYAILKNIQPNITERDIELIFNFKLKNLK
jgi:hypothetical protein